MEDSIENRKQFALLMGELGVAFRVDASREMMGVYWKFLHDRTMRQVRLAIEDIIKSGDKFPPVSRIRDIAGSYREFKTVEKVPESRQIEEFTGPPPDFDETFDEMLARVCGETKV